MYYFFKLLISAGLIVAITEVAKTNAILGGLIKSLPLVSLIALIWLYVETHNVEKVAELSTSTLWFVLPTLPLFLVLPYLLKKGFGFYLSLLIAIGVMLCCYGITMLLLKRLGYML